MEPKQLRGNGSSRAASILCSALSVIPCRTRTLAGAAEELYFAGGFQNCHRGKADFCSCSFPRSVIVHYSITVLKAKNKKSEEWIPVTFVNLLSSVNTAGFG